MPLIQVWTLFLFFTFSELKIYEFGNVNTLRDQLIFLPNPFFELCLNFQQQNPLKIQYLPHLRSEYYEIKSIKSDLSRAFQQHPQFQHIFQFWFSVIFIEKIVQHLIASTSQLQTVSNPVDAPLLIKATKSLAPSAMVWENLDMTKQNKLPCFIDRHTPVLTRCHEDLQVQI